jgi:hypothetical protein
MITAQVAQTQERGSQVPELAVMIAAVSLVAMVPHDQDPGRLYAYTQLWCPAAASALCADAAAARRALQEAFGKPVTNQGPEQAHTQSPPASRVCVSLDVQTAALRFERHEVERRLSLTHAVHAHTAAALAALHGAGGEYEKMRIAAVSRAAAHRSAAVAISAPKLSELLAASAVHDALVPALLTHDRCAHTLHAVALHPHCKSTIRCSFLLQCSWVCTQHTVLASWWLSHW